MAHRSRPRFSNRRGSGRISRGGKPDFGAYKRAVQEGIKLINDIKRNRRGNI